MNSGSGGKQGFMEAGTKGWVVLTWWIKGRGMVHSGAPGQSKSWRCGTLHVRPPDATGRWCRNWRGCGWVGSIRRPYWSRSRTWHRRKRRATCSAVVRGQHTVQPARGTERTLGAHGGEAGEETTRYAEQRGPGISGPQSSWQREREVRTPFGFQHTTALMSPEELCFLCQTQFQSFEWSQGDSSERQDE